MCEPLLCARLWLTGFAIAVGGSSLSIASSRAWLKIEPVALAAAGHGLAVLEMERRGAKATERGVGVAQSDEGNGLVPGSVSVWRTSDMSDPQTTLTPTP